MTHQPERRRLSTDDRLFNYRRQRQGGQFTPRQMRRVEHKRNHALAAEARR
jgi:hypothetical protein